AHDQRARAAVHRQTPAPRASEAEAAASEAEAATSETSAPGHHAAGTHSARTHTAGTHHAHAATPANASCCTAASTSTSWCSTTWKHPSHRSHPAHHPSSREGRGFQQPLQDLLDFLRILIAESKNANPDRRCRFAFLVVELGRFGRLS